MVLKFLAPLILLPCLVACQSQGDDDSPKPTHVLPHFANLVKFPGTTGRDLDADLFQPDPAKSLHRCVVVLHGGGWSGGSRGEMSEISEQLAVEGFTAFDAEYTLAGQGTRWPIQLTDVQAAVRYVRSHATDLGVDPAKIGAIGISAGGHLSSFLGSVDEPKDGVSSKVQAVISISGLHDLRMKMTSSGEQFHIVEHLLSDTANPTDEQKAGASPIMAYTATTAPTYFIMGDKDPLVPPDQSTKAMEKLNGLKVEAKYVLVPGMGHGLQVKDSVQAKALDVAADWLKDKLK